MADDVTITFTADVSDLQQGMQQATSAVEATTSALRSGAAQINSSFASLSQASGSAAAKNIATVRTSSDTELAVARQSVQAQYDIASNGVKEQVSLVKEQAQTARSRANKSSPVSSRLRHSVKTSSVSTSNSCRTLINKGPLPTRPLSAASTNSPVNPRLGGKKSSAMSPSRSMPTTNAASTRLPQVCRPRSWA
jgi:hypothetical protein